ncbi:MULTISPECIES: TetR/AcrR family transcriptional regulator [unclassified Pseudofrankia]|uniref:TetR/AcrR family transcriptional regulator n=1 Tax=unclassified Pseudofrankia TaxID=2994372 RepID=UPI0008DA0135|nr:MULTISPECIES: TetR/AcrR family transcriptional regulator [unclassified Pseudofrankia]MDT3444759.1 TetR/AcrR family transcriptional regulator [Pseudofrankia sp. BMG5.37]OHV50440.1 TetR family transcriptional regulator [Pseudofrankia sp. BMG5.36]
MSQQTVTESTNTAEPLTWAPRSHDARLRLLLTAERLYAEHGLEAVSLRQICRAAGNGNNNAVQYHFGGERGLLAAIVAHRVPPLDQRRAELLATGRTHGRDQTVRGLFDVLMRPLAEEARRPDSYYVGFLGRFGAHPLEDHPWWAGGRPAGEVGHEVSLAILDLLAEVPRPLRALRLSHMVRLCLAALAGYDRIPAGKPDGPYPGTGGEISYELYVTDLFDMAAAALTAPLSAESHAGPGPD